MKIWLKAFLFFVMVSGQSVFAGSSGGVTIGGTRLIYDGDRKEASLSVTNSDTIPYLIQSWTETREGGAEKAPFIITPPLFRLDSNQSNVLRVVRTGGALPEDRESLYWLNVKSIPSSLLQNKSTNTLQLAVKSQIKLIYRPASLTGKPDQQTEKLRWQISGSKITVTNPTPFVMNFKQVTIGNKEVKDATYVLPMSQTTFSVPAGATGRVSWKLITDYGGIGPQHTSEY